MKTHFPHRSTIPILLALLAAAFLPGRAWSEDAPKAVKPTGRCLMWKVTSDTAVVYLLGSIQFSSRAGFTG